MQIHWEVLYRYPAVTMGLLQILAIWLLAALGWMELPNWLLYDRFLALGLPFDRPAHVLLLEADGSQEDPAALNALVRRLHDLGARSIGLELPLQDTELLDLAFEYGNLVLSRRLLVDETGQHRPKPLPPEWEQDGLVYGYLEAPPQRYGIHRGHWIWLEANGQPRVSFLARLADLRDELPSAEIFYPKLGMNSAELLPRLGFRQALEGGLVEELVRDRCVIIAPSQENFSPLETPIGALPPAVYDALVLNALIDQHGIRFAGTGAMLAGIAIIVAANLFVAQMIPLQGALWGGVGLCFAYIAGAWLALHGLGVWLPLTEYLLSQILVFLVLYRQLALNEQRSLHNLATRLRLEVRKQVIPSGFYQTDDHWTYVAVLVQQLFDLERVIFLERIRGDHRLREIKALNCSLDSIDEKRRDYERTPYSTAISELSPIELDRAFFKNTDPDEVQFLAPMIYAGDVLGFWAIGFIPGSTQRDPNFVSRLRDFSEQLGYLLHARQEWQGRRIRDEQVLDSFLRFQAGESPFRNLNLTTAALQKRLFQLRAVINELESFCIVYDLFGRVVLINRSMEKLAKQEKLLPYDLTMADFTAELTGYSINHVRSLMQSIIFMGSTFSLPVILGEQRFFILNLKPLKAVPEEEETAPELAEARPFQLQGVLFELLEITTLVGQFRAQDDLLQRILAQLQRSLTSILLEADLPERNQPDASNQLTHALRKRVETVVPVLEQMQEHLRLDFLKLMDRASAILPVDGIKPLETAVAELAEHTQRFDVKVQLILPAAPRLVLASAGELREVYDCLLAVLAVDSISNGVISIDIENRERHVQLRFKNQGFGLPVEKLRAYVEQDVADVPRPFAGLREAAAKVLRWGGELTLNSSLAEGIEATLMLDVFL